MNKTTVMIKTIGRDTLQGAIDSALREGFTPMVISDGIPLPELGVETITLGKRWGYYGGMVTNVAAALCPTEFMTLLDDDDEFREGAGEVVRAALDREPDIDVWIGGVHFKEPITLYNREGKEVFQSHDLACSPEAGVVVGNVAMPTYRTSIFSTLPFLDHVPEGMQNCTDYFHIKACDGMGHKIGWFGEVIYNVRPNVAGTNGEGV